MPNVEDAEWALQLVWKSDKGQKLFCSGHHAIASHFTDLAIASSPSYYTYFNMMPKGPNCGVSEASLWWLADC